MAKVKIGGDEYEVAELNFVSLERAWPYVEQARISLDPMQAVNAGLHVIAAGLIEMENFDPTLYGIEVDKLDARLESSDQIFHQVVYFLRKKLKAREIGDVQLAIMDILQEAGLDADPGELVKMAELMMNPSTEHSETSSPSSSPQDAKEEAGKE